jgi:hypothetical protein
MKYVILKSFSIFLCLIVSVFAECPQNKGKCKTGDKVIITKKGLEKVSNYSLSSLDLNKALSTSKKQYDLPEIEKTIPNMIVESLRGSRFIGNHMDDHKVKIKMPDFSIKKIDLGSPKLYPAKDGVSKVCVPINKLVAQSDLEVSSLKDKGKVLSLRKHNAVIGKNSSGQTPTFCLKVRVVNKRNGNGVKLEVIKEQNLKKDILVQASLRNLRNEKLENLTDQEIEEYYKSLSKAFLLPEFNNRKDAIEKLSKLQKEDRGSLNLPDGSFKVAPFEDEKTIKELRKHVSKESIKLLRNLQEAPNDLNHEGRSRFIFQFYSKDKFFEVLNSSDASLDIQKKSAAKDVYSAIKSMEFDPAQSGAENLISAMNKKFKPTGYNKRRLGLSFSDSDDALVAMMKKRKEGQLNLEDVENYFLKEEKYIMQDTFELLYDSENSEYRKMGVKLFYYGAKKKVSALEKIPRDDKIKSPVDQMMKLKKELPGLSLIANNQKYNEAVTEEEKFKRYDSLSDKKGEDGLHGMASLALALTKGTQNKGYSLFNNPVINSAIETNLHNELSNVIIDQINDSIDSSELSQILAGQAFDDLRLPELSVQSIIDSDVQDPKLNKILDYLKETYQLLKDQKLNTDELRKRTNWISKESDYLMKGVHDKASSLDMANKLQRIEKLLGPLQTSLPNKSGFLNKYSNAKKNISKAVLNLQNTRSKILANSETDRQFIDIKTSLSVLELGKGLQVDISIPELNCDEVPEEKFTLPKESDMGVQVSFETINKFLERMHKNGDFDFCIDKSNNRTCTNKTLFSSRVKCKFNSPPTISRQKEKGGAPLKLNLSKTDCSASVLKNSLLGSILTSSKISGEFGITPMVSNGSLTLGISHQKTNLNGINKSDPISAVFSGIRSATFINELILNRTVRTLAKKSNHSTGDIDVPLVQLMQPVIGDNSIMLPATVGSELKEVIDTNINK